ncbi:uncharacterized protein LOC105787181 [Gossypium raimondii]|uniref:uncharacterized protein LOC105787181 n=1 Tax=Gossypium raimondii TaxID=29730 RepID=UPI00063AF847|nr:uncharacterized protein LOC105787181 [Gossypium raimondii]
MTNGMLKHQPITRLYFSTRLIFSPHEVHRFNIYSRQAMPFSLDSGPCSRLPANTQLLYRQKMSNILPVFGFQSFDAQQGGFSTQVSPHPQHRSRPFISQHYDQRCNPPARGSGSGHLHFRKMEIRFLRTADLFILGREFICSETQPRNLHRVRNYRSVRLPSLKVLHLRSVTYANNKSVSKLLQGCTVLEELIVKRTFKDNARNFIVHLPTLKTLNIKVQFDKMSKLRSKYDLTINAPNLGYLEIIDWESVIQFESVFISLVEVTMELPYSKWWKHFAMLSSFT